MHNSALRIGGKFFANYFTQGKKEILEIGAYDVNGTLRLKQPIGSNWTGVDIENGPGVDLVVKPAEKLPFDDNSFDLVVATSVFEHDPAFWKTLREMARVVREDGVLFISAPSNGMVHRFPLDCFRFYPDACVSFLDIIREVKPNSAISESFVGAQDHEGLWNDYVAVFKMDGAKRFTKIFETEDCANVWADGIFLSETTVEFTEDQRNASQFLLQLNEAKSRVHQIENSWSWRLTSPLRSALKLARLIRR
jgi:SAM-dependent methyltransferase